MYHTEKNLVLIPIQDHIMSNKTGISKIDKTNALQILGLNEKYSNAELIQSYRIMADDVLEQLRSADHRTIHELADQLYECSASFLVLNADTGHEQAEPQPLAIFTDASVKQNIDRATFAIVAKNIPFNIDIPVKILKKYNIRFEPESSEEMCILTGEIVNYSVDAAEIMAIIAAVDILQYLTRVSKQKMVIYTDSLSAKKILGNKRLSPGFKTFSELRKIFLGTNRTNNLDVVIKKVDAHSGIEMNEIADNFAKQRLILTD